VSFAEPTSGPELEKPHHFSFWSRRRIISLSGAEAASFLFLEPKPHHFSFWSRSRIISLSGAGAASFLFLEPEPHHFSFWSRSCIKL
jgi:hypothetical protein